MSYFYTCQGQFKINNIIENFTDTVIEHNTSDDDFYNFIDTFISSGEFAKLGLTEDDVLDSNLITTLTQNDISNNIASNLVSKYLPPITDSDGNVTQSDFLDDDTPTKYRNDITNDIDFRFLNCGQQSLCLGHMMKYVCTALIIKLKAKVINALNELKEDMVNRVTTIPILSKLESYASFNTENDKVNAFIDKMSLGSLNEFKSACKSVHTSIIDSSDTNVVANRETLKSEFKTALEALKTEIINPNNIIAKIYDYINTRNSYDFLTRNVSVLNIDVNIDNTKINKNIYKCQFINNQDFANLSILNGNIYSVTPSTTPSATDITGSS